MAKDEVAQLSKENERLRRAVEELSILNEIAIAINSSLSLEKILETIVNKCTKHLQVEQVAVMLLDEKEEEKPFQTMIRGWDSSPNVMPYRLDTQLTGWMLKNRQPLMTNNFQEDDRFFTDSAKDMPIHSLLGVPLLCQARMIGLICVFNKKTEQGFHADDQRLLSIIATQSTQVIENARLLAEEQAYLKMQEELTMAYNIQTTLLPSAPPKIEGYDIAGRSVPAKEVGGDYFDFISLDDHHFVFCLGDVSGKGMPAALLMSNLQASVRGQAMLSASVTECLQYCNTMLFHNTPPEKFATFFYGMLDPIEHKLTYANAGHNYPFVFSSTTDPNFLGESDIVLGCFESYPFKEHHITLNPGDIIIIYSDGIVEAVDNNGQEFGEENLLRIAKENPGVTAQQLSDKIYEAVNNHASNCPQMDDMTMVVIKRLN